MYLVSISRLMLSLLTISSTIGPIVDLRKWGATVRTNCEQNWFTTLLPLSAEPCSVADTFENSSCNSNLAKGMERLVFTNRGTMARTKLSIDEASIVLERLQVNLEWSKHGGLTGDWKSGGLPSWCRGSRFPTKTLSSRWGLRSFGEKSGLALGIDTRNRRAKTAFNLSVESGIVSEFMFLLTPKPK